MARLGRALPNRTRIRQLGFLGTAAATAAFFVPVIQPAAPVGVALQASQVIAGRLPANPIGGQAPPYTIRAAAVGQPLASTVLTVGFHPPLWPAPRQQHTITATAIGQPLQPAAVGQASVPGQPVITSIPVTRATNIPAPLQTAQVSSRFEPRTFAAPISEWSNQYVANLTAPAPSASVQLGTIPSQPAPLGFVISATVPPPQPRPAQISANFHPPLWPAPVQSWKIQTANIAQPPASVQAIAAPFGGYVPVVDPVQPAPIIPVVPQSSQVIAAPLVSVVVVGNTPYVPVTQATVPPPALQTAQVWATFEPRTFKAPITEWSNQLVDRIPVAIPAPQVQLGTIPSQPAPIGFVIQASNVAQAVAAANVARGSIPDRPAPVALFIQTSAITPTISAPQLTVEFHPPLWPAPQTAPVVVTVANVGQPLQAAQSYGFRSITSVTIAVPGSVCFAAAAPTVTLTAAAPTAVLTAVAPTVTLTATSPSVLLAAAAPTVTLIAPKEDCL